jgi:hypothetical protein
VTKRGCSLRRKTVQAPRARRRGWARADHKQESRDLRQPSPLCRKYGDLADQNIEQTKVSDEGGPEMRSREGGGSFDVLRSLVQLIGSSDAVRFSQLYEADGVLSVLAFRPGNRSMEGRKSADTDVCSLPLWASPCSPAPYRPRFLVLIPTLFRACRARAVETGPVRKAMSGWQVRGKCANGQARLLCTAEYRRSLDWPR